MTNKNRHRFGSRNGRAKITEQQAKEIIALRGQLSQSRIAEMYGLTQPIVSHIQIGRIWKHLER
jgi:predicted XRE-type DNA-binding protein